MKPVLYAPNETAFETNGLGTLTDAVECVVTEERNGEYILEMKYPTTGIHYADIALRSLILARPNKADRPQPFRVYRITRPMAGTVTVYAQHISYDLSGIPVEPFAALTASAAVAGMAAHSVTENPFSMDTDITTAADFTVKTPASYRAIMGGTEGSLLQAFRGEYAFDRFEVHYLQHRGQDRGARIEYGRNLTDIKQDENNAATYTEVYPYWQSDEEGIVEASPRLIPAMGTHDHTRVMMLDLTEEFDEKPTPEQVAAAGQAYVVNNDIGVPSVSLTVSWAQDPGTVDAVELCDTVHVNFPPLGVVATAKVIRTVYDVLRDRFNEVTIGDPASNFAETVAKQYERIESVDRYVTASNVQLRKMVIDTAEESRTAIERISGDGDALNLTELTQTADRLSGTVATLEGSVAGVLTETGGLLEFKETTEGQIKVLGYIRAVEVDGQVVVIIGDNDATHSKMKLIRDRLIIGNTPDDDTTTADASAWFTESAGYIKEFTAVLNMQLGDDQGTSWQFAREADGDLLLMRV